MGTETTDVTEVTPPTDEVETDTQTYRVLRRDDVSTAVWREEEPISTRYTPDATEVGEKYGEGDYLLIEVDTRYSFHSTYPMRVVAARKYREAREDESWTA